ncbi:hypothetical protein V1511DRAFT_117875 [Dipodascopsis uninucleata]
MSQPSSLPTIRWGIIGAGWISSWFVEDLQVARPNPKANHIIQAIGSSSLQKSQKFAKDYYPKLCPCPSLYGSYQELYADPHVDVIYVGTPHAFHAEQVLEMLEAGKHVLCEKPITINAKEAQKLANVAREKGLFLMEAMWTRFTPAVAKLRQLIHVDKEIGEVKRVLVDFGFFHDVDNKSEASRIKNINLGAGVLIDMGVYCLTLAKLALDRKIGKDSDVPKVTACHSLFNNVDYITSVILQYPDTDRQGICTITAYCNSDPDNFMRVEGTNGVIIVGGVNTARPNKVTLTYRNKKKNPVIYDFPAPGRGFYWEADAVAVDIVNGKTEDDLMPLDETLFIMKLLDDIRFNHEGTIYPQDAE